jgi:6-phosphogluconolactonase
MGKLIAIQRISSHPSDYKGDIGSADIHLSPDGKFLYASNRGDANSIAIYSVNTTTGRLQSKGFQSTLGEAPEIFTIDPTGKYFISGKPEQQHIVIFKRNLTTGSLTPTGKQIEVPKQFACKLPNTNSKFVNAHAK